MKKFKKVIIVILVILLVIVAGCIYLFIPLESTVEGVNYTNGSLSAYSIEENGNHLIITWYGDVVLRTVFDYEFSPNDTLDKTTITEYYDNKLTTIFYYFDHKNNYDYENLKMKGNSVIHTEEATELDTATQEEFLNSMTEYFTRNNIPKIDAQ